MAGQVIKVDADYSGVRVTFLAYLENARVPMQIDIGFGDVVVPDAPLTDYPTLLELQAPRLRTYPRETVVAEKFEAMVKTVANVRLSKVSRVDTTVPCGAYTTVTLKFTGLATVGAATITE